MIVKSIFATFKYAAASKMPISFFASAGVSVVVPSVAAGVVFLSAALAVLVLSAASAVTL